MAVSPRNSGGPLVDEKGAAIGIVSAILNGQRIARVGFAVPIALACQMLDRNKIQYEFAPKTKPLAGPELARHHRRTAESLGQHSKQTVQQPVIQIHGRIQPERQGSAFHCHPARTAWLWHGPTRLDKILYLKCSHVQAFSDPWRTLPAGPVQRYLAISCNRAKSRQRKRSGNDKGLFSTQLENSIRNFGINGALRRHQ